MPAHGEDFALRAAGLTRGWLGFGTRGISPCPFWGGWYLTIEGVILRSGDKLVQPLKWHGGKFYLAERIISLMPKHTHYVEPFFGGGSVLLNKSPEGISEVVNDKHRLLTNFWRVLQSEGEFEQFRRIVEAIPFSQVEWEDSKQVASDPIREAVQFFVRCRQSRAGKLNAFATLSRTRTRRRMNEQAAAWMTAVEGLPRVAERLRRVVILCDDAVKVIRSQDGADTLFYLDPPYLHETRVTTADYDHEMTTEQHVQLLEAIDSCQARVLLSGYPNRLYDERLAGWHVVDIAIDNKASSAKTKPKMIERLWMNYTPSDPPAEHRTAADKPATNAVRQLFAT